MSGKRAWPPPRSRRPSTAAETSGWPPSCRPELGGDLSAGAAPVSRRVHDSGCRRSAKEIGTEWLPVSHNGPAPGSGAASAGRVRWPSGWAPPAIDGRWKLTTDSPLAKGASTSGRPCGSSVPDTTSTRLPAIRWQRAKTPDATPEPDLCPMCRAPFLYAQATAVRTAVLMSRKTYCSGGR